MTHSAALLGTAYACASSGKGPITMTIYAKSFITFDGNQRLTSATTAQISLTTATPVTSAAALWYSIRNGTPTVRGLNIPGRSLRRVDVTTAHTYALSRRKRGGFICCVVTSWMYFRWRVKLTGTVLAATAITAVSATA